MLNPIKKLTLSICAIALLGANANAGWLDNVQNVMNQLIEQVQQKQTSNQQQTDQTQEQQTEQKQEQKPVFNSLAEEKAYNEQQAKLQQEAEAQKKLDIERNIMPIIHKIEAMRASVYEKYLVKNTDTLAMIDDKYKNRVQLDKEIEEDLLAYKNAIDSLKKADRDALYANNISIPDYFIIP